MMNRLLIKRLFFAFTPVYAPYCPPFAELNTDSYVRVLISVFLYLNFCDCVTARF